MKKIIFLLFIVIAVSCGDSSPKKNKLIPVDLALNWFPEVEHGGFYAALVHGYYREQGLDVTIIPGGPSTPVLQKVARGAIPFGISNADKVILAKAQKANVSVLMAPIQKSPRCIIVHKNSKITELSDVKNIKLFMSLASSFAQYIRYKLPLKGVTIVPYKGSIVPFLYDKNSAQQGYIFSEPFIAEKQGIAVRSILLADALDFNPYTSILIANPNFLKKHPEVARKIVLASQKGWKMYMKNSQETNKYIHKLNPKMTLDILNYGSHALKELVYSDFIDETTLGKMKDERWEKLWEQMDKAGMISLEKKELKNIYSNDFLYLPK